MTTYVMKEDHVCFKKGDKVYTLRHHDYGLANDDERYTGEPHRTVTADENGGYPGQTVPCHKLQALES